MPTTISFPEIHARLERHSEAEAARNAPKAEARRTVYALTSLLAALSASDRAAVLELLKDELYEMPVTA